MIGRSAYEDCYLLANFYKLYEDFENKKPISRGDVIKAYTPYILEELEKGNSVHALVSPLHSLFQGQKGSKKYRQFLSSSNVKKETIIEILNNILETMPEDTLWN